MFTVEEIATALSDRRIAIVAKATGLHHNTIAAIRDGKVKDPSYRVVSKLSEYLKGRGHENISE